MDEEFHAPSGGRRCWGQQQAAPAQASGRTASQHHLRGGGGGGGGGGFGSAYQCGEGEGPEGSGSASYQHHTEVGLVLWAAWAAEAQLTSVRRVCC
jgi:hypothetical protein